MKNNSWPEVSLGDYTDFLTGFPFKSAKYVNDPNGIRLLRGDNIVQGALRWENCKRWTSAEIEQFSKYSLEYNDIVLAMDRPWIEAGLKWAYIKESDLPCLLVQRVSRLRGKNELLTNFIRYIISDINFTNYVKSVITGINIPHISGPQIQAYQFRLPPIKTQQKITSILSNYDNLIENNTRRIEILEQMAKLVYEEWFVKFRFPGHEYVKIIDGVPEGWNKTNALEIMDVLSGGTPKTSVPDFWDGNIPFFTPKDSTDTPYVLETEKSISEQGLSKCNSKLYPKDTIFITARGTVGKLNLAQVPMAMNQSCYALVGKEPLTQYFLYCALNSAINEFKSRAVGAVFDAIVRDTFKAIPFVMPTQDLIDDFTEMVTPSFKQIDSLIMKNQNLRKTRDLLLPKLISGEIDVSDLDIRIRNEFQERNFNFGEPQDEKGFRFKMV